MRPYIDYCAHTLVAKDRLEEKMKENSHFSDFLQVKNIIHFILYVSRFAFKFKVSQYVKLKITKDGAADIYNIGILLYYRCSNHGASHIALWQFEM